jgi:hypothetical protein
MAPLSDNRIAWTYTADDGTTYRVAAVAAYTSQGVLGGSAWNGSDKPKPASIRMRRISVRDVVNGQSRVVPVYTPGAPICVAGTTINLNRLGDSYAYKSSGNPIPQSHQRSNVTTQSA